MQTATATERALGRGPQIPADLVPAAPTWETTPHTTEFIMWHPETHPDGYRFVFRTDGTQDVVTPEELAEDGWVDNPAKIGSNPWGSKKDIVLKVEQTKAAFEADDLPALDDPAATLQSVGQLRKLTSEQQGLLEASKAREAALTEELERVKAENAAYESMRTTETPTGREKTQVGQETEALSDAVKQHGRQLNPDAAAKRGDRGKPPTPPTPPAAPKP